MENIKIKKYYNKMSEDSKIILVNILADNLIYLHDFEVVDKKVIKSISSLLLLFINHNTKTKIKEFDEFSVYEKKIFKEPVRKLKTKKFEGCRKSHSDRVFSDSASNAEWFKISFVHFV